MRKQDAQALVAALVWGAMVYGVGVLVLTVISW